MNWDELAQSIADGEAVLVLGPDAIPFYPAQGGGESRSFSDLSRGRILEDLNGQISHFYQRDNLYQFSGRGAKHEAMKCVRDAASDANWLADSELLRQIVAIPFPVVLSVNPDKCLWQAFAQHYREPQFDYFTAKDKPAQVEIAYPDGLNRPLIYNLCGSVLDKRDSVVLDYFDLFEMLKNVLADQGIPKALTDKLKDSDRFILLGFELDRWYFQLFLHYLNRLDENPFNDNPNQNFPILSRVSEDARQFVMNQFNIRHIAASRDEFDALYAACERRGILRKLNDPRSPVETQIRMLTAQGKYEEAFDLLEQHLGATEKSINLPHLRGRYTDWLRQKNEGTADSRDLATEQNRIRYALLTFANQIPQQP
ncbi:MAG: hypothetical protein ACKV1O_15985 [Saprospiraceae bacterium]